MSKRPYVVIDACIAGAWIFQEQYTAQALAVLDAVEHYTAYPVVPDRFFIEVLRVCQKKTLADSIQPVTSSDAWKRFQLIQGLPILSVPLNEPVYSRAWQIAQDARLTVHDALYVALAQEWSLPLWTLDAGLANTPPSVYPDIFDLSTVMFPY